MGCSIAGNGKEGPHILDGKPSGLILNHAYGISDVMELQDPYDKKKPLKFLRLRNPWGKSEWLGAWSSESAEMKKYRKTIDAYIADLPPDEQFNPDDDDGTFLMSFNDWKDNFTQLFINIDFPDTWTGVRFKSEWTPSNSGGLPNTYTNDALERYARNPQFYIKTVNDA